MFLEMTDSDRLMHVFNLITEWFAAGMILLGAFTALPRVIRFWRAERRGRRRLAGDRPYARSERTAWAGPVLLRWSRESTIAILIALALAIVSGLDLLFSEAVAFRPPLAKYLLKFACVPLIYGWWHFHRVTRLREWVEEKEAESRAGS